MTTKATTIRKAHSGLLHDEQQENERRQFWALLVVFGANGFQAGLYTVLIADLASTLRLSGTELGIALATLSAIGIVSVIAAGWVADRIGRRPVLVFGVAGAGLFYVLLATVRSYPAMLAIFALGGLLLGFFDMIPNTLGGDQERQWGKAAMTRLYVGKDGAAAAGSLMGGIALGAGVGFRLVYAALGLLLLLLAVVSTRLPLPDRARAVDKPHQQGHRRLTWLVKGVVLAALLVFLVSLVEAALEGYASLYLRDILMSGALLGGVSIAIYQFARMLGQVWATSALGWMGERGVLALAGVGTVGGVAMLIVTQRPWVSAAGLLLIGLSAAPVSPVAFSLAARAAPERSGRAIATTWAAFYAAFLAGPLLVGVLADSIGLRFALAIFVVTSLAIPALAVFVPAGPAHCMAEHDV